MIYLRRNGEFAICEDERHAQAREAEGFTRCSWLQCRSLWRARDLAELPAQPAEPVAQIEQARQIPQTWPGQ